MFNINHLLNSTLQSSPWAHQTVSGFFENDDRIKVTEGIQRLLDSLDPTETYDSDTSISIYDAKDIIGQEAFDIIAEANESILDNISSIFAKYPNHRNYSSIMCVPAFSVIAPNHIFPFINDSAIDKVCNIVSFMKPHAAVESVLYKANDSSPGADYLTISNQYNTGLVYCPVSNVTWEKYNTNTSGYVMLNFFVSNNIFNSISTVGDTYQYYTLEGRVVTISKNAASDATIADAQAGKLVRNL
jgi:hypothetical protein